MRHDYPQQVEEELWKAVLNFKVNGPGHLRHVRGGCPKWRQGGAVVLCDVTD